jgi:hypothetical protein
MFIPSVFTTCCERVKSLMSMPCVCCSWWRPGWSRPTSPPSTLSCMAALPHPAALTSHELQQGTIQGYACLEERACAA